MRKVPGSMAVALCVCATTVAAQSSAGEVHANYQRAVNSKTNAWGGGAQYQLTIGAKKAPVQLSTSLGLDWTQQENSGPTQTSGSYDAALQPGGGGSFTPYAGGSVGANWSGGSGKQWDGAKLGLEALAGFQAKFGLKGVSWNAQERFGYVRGQDHNLTTRVGVIVSF